MIATLNRAISHLSEHAAGIGTLVVKPVVGLVVELIVEAVKTALNPGCRGFIGPVPPPLWIRVVLFDCGETIATDAGIVKLPVKLSIRFALVTNWRSALPVH